MPHVLCFLALTLAYSFPDVRMRPNATLVGQWRGFATPSHSAILAPGFPVEIEIHRDGTVTGRVGDAVLRDTRFLRHRPPGVSRDERHDVMDYIIRGQLDGPVAASPQITAAELFVPLDYDRGRLTGAVHMHGTSVDGTHFGIFSSDVTLRRLPR